MSTIDSDIDACVSCLNEHNLSGVPFGLLVGTVAARVRFGAGFLFGAAMTERAAVTLF